MPKPSGGSLLTIDRSDIRGEPRVKAEAFFYEGKWWTLKALKSQEEVPKLSTLPMGQFVERGSDGTWTLRFWTDTQRKRFWSEPKGTIPPKR